MNHDTRGSNERHLLWRVSWSLVFGGFGMICIQKPLIGLLSTLVVNWLAYALAYIASGQVVFLLDFFVARYRRGFTRAHFQQIDWHDFRVSWYMHNGLSIIGSAINACSLLWIRPSDLKTVNVLIANALSAVFTQVIKWTYVHRPHKPKKPSRRKE